MRSQTHRASSQTAVARTVPARQQRLARPRAAGPASAAGKRALIVYTKPDCPLCDGLKDKVAGLLARAQFIPSLLSSYSLEVRDVSTSEDWAAAYAHEVPVLAAEYNGQQVVLPRPMPRITAERLQKHIESGLSVLEAGEPS